VRPISSTSGPALVSHVCSLLCLLRDSVRIDVYLSGPHVGEIKVFFRFLGV